MKRAILSFFSLIVLVGAMATPAEAQYHHHHRHCWYSHHHRHCN